MGDKHKINRFFLSLLVVFTMIFSASFLIADSYSYFTTEVLVTGELVTEEDFGIPLPLQAEEEQVKEAVEKEQREKQESAEEKEKPADDNKETTEQSETVKEEKEEDESGSESEEEDSEVEQETSEDKEPEGDNSGDETGEVEDGEE